MFLSQYTQIGCFRGVLEYRQQKEVLMRQAIRAVVINNDKLLVMKRNKFGKEYYTLIGDGIELDEDQETALRRELMEETGMQVGAVRLVYEEEPGEPYGTQFVYLCEYQGGEPVLSPDSIEAQISAAGQNTYEPMWLAIADLPNVNFVSGSLKTELIRAMQQGFPNEPIQLDWQA